MLSPVGATDPFRPLNSEPPQRTVPFLLRIIAPILGRGGKAFRFSCQRVGWKSSYHQYDVYQSISAPTHWPGVINNPQPNDGDESWARRQGAALVQ